MQSYYVCFVTIESYLNRFVDISTARVVFYSPKLEADSGPISVFLKLLYGLSPAIFAYRTRYLTQLLQR